jgi:pyridoxamine 5'-phosphate oxidase
MPDRHQPGLAAVRELLRAMPVFSSELPAFDAGAAPDDPVTLFADWLTLAISSKVPEPHAMALSTVNDHGKPSSRVLICKDVDATGRWYFASSSASRKGRELEANPCAALMFYWPQHAMPRSVS